jgi:PKD repeat protein
MRRLLASLAVCALAAPAAATHAKATRNANHLLSVITPVVRTTVPAHPHVNVIVRFSTSPDGYVPDPSTFRARIGRADITTRFRSIVENGAIVGLRAELLPPQVHLGRRANNRLRFEVKSHPRSGPPPHVVRDIDRIRFRAKAAENQPPVPSLVPPSEVIFPDVDLAFDATASRDPELDELTYAWDFGDGGTATAAKPSHAFSGGTGSVDVRLTVSDGAATATDRVTLIECPAVDDGRTPGIVRIDADQALEFGAVPPGGQGSLAFTVTNTDPTATSQLHVQLRVDGAGFRADPPTLDLGPSQSAPVTLTFSPADAGHRSADVVAVASASNRCAVHLLAHGYGGTAPGTGPTGASGPLFYNSFSGNTVGILPAGDRFTLDTSVHVCQTPGNGIGTGDLCVVDDDCAANGGTCNQALPGTFFIVDACSDGQGALYLMSDDGSYTDPTATDNDLSVTILRLNVDPNGNRTGAHIVARETSGTTQLACDQVAPAAGGKLYVSEFREVTTPANCLRSEQEALLSIHKNTGTKDPPLVSRVDAAEGFDACDDDIDEVIDLNVSADGLSAFASLEEGGLFQLRPTFRMITPDIRDAFQIHPDGDIVSVSMRNTGTTGLINVFRLSPQQAASGAIHLDDLQPCATFKVPNNRGPQNIGQVGQTGDHFFAIGRTSPDTLDGVLLVGFFTSGAVSDTPPALPPKLRVQGVVAFSMPAGTASCSTLGLLNLDLVEALTF